MKSIALTQGKVAVVDDADFEFLSQFKWYAMRNGQTFYAMKALWEDRKRRHTAMHRLLLQVPDDIEVDHVDGDGMNNTRINLRPCTRSQNVHNKKKMSGATSRYKGVYWNKRDKRWVAHIRGEGKLLHLGYFISEREAALAYNWAATKYFGEFARLNQLGNEVERA